MTKEELIEQLADKEHSSWARWMAYLFSICEKDTEWNVTISGSLVKRWMRQIETPYADLSEQEKQSDRDEVAHILPIIEAYKFRGDLIEPPTARSTVVRWVDCNEVEHSISTIDDDEVTVRCLLLLVKQARGEVLKIRVEH